MSQRRYLTSFLISALAFLILGLLLLSIAKIEKQLTSTPPQVIKIALLSPIKPIKKVIKPITVPVEIPQVVAPPAPIVKKVVKPKKKPIVHKPKPKKIIKKPKPKPKKVIKKVKPKKIIKKNKPKVMSKKHMVTKKHIVKKTIKKIPIKEVYTPPKPIYHTPVPIIKRVTKNNNADNGKAKNAFLRHIRAKIIANKKYPKLALRRHIEGSVKVRFDITARGEVSNIRFINGKTIFQKSIRKTLARTFPVGIPPNMRRKLPISDVSVVLHFNIR